MIVYYIPQTQPCMFLPMLNEVTPRLAPIDTCFRIKIEIELSNYAFVLCIQFIKLVSEGR